MQRFMPHFLRRYIAGVQDVREDWKTEQSVMQLRYSLLGAVIFCMAAHAFAYFNFAPLHDGVNYVSHFAGKWEVSLGRFLQPMYGHLRGEYTIPWMSGMLSMLYIGLAAFLINNLFEVNRRGIALLTAGFLSANATMTNMTMVFSYATDAFALALLLACAGAYAVIRMKNLLGVLLSSACFTAAMGLYQSYALFGGLLLMVHAMMQAMSDRHVFKNQAMNWLRYVAAVMLTAVMYFVACQIFLHYYGAQIASADCYNSPARLASLDIKGLIPLVREAYASFAEYFFGSFGGELTLIQKGSVVLVVLGGVLLALYAVMEKLPVFNVLLIAAGSLLFPGVGQAASILAQHGRIYFLTAHALFLMYPTLLIMLTRIRLGARSGENACLFACSGVFRVCVYVLCGCILFGNIRYSNEMYTFRAVQYDKTISYVTRLMERIDSVPGYERNQTEVVFTGYSSAGLSNLKEPEGWTWMEGMNNSAVTYLQVLKSFVHLMGEQMNITLDYSDLPDYASMEAVKAMPAFPSPACCMMIDGRLLVKLTGY